MILNLLENHLEEDVRMRPRLLVDRDMLRELINAELKARPECSHLSIDFSPLALPSPDVGGCNWNQQVVFSRNSHTPDPEASQIARRAAAEVIAKVAFKYNLVSGP
jgi:hypothetical protein